MSVGGSSDGEIVSSGVDWITATARRGKHDLDLTLTAGAIMNLETQAVKEQREWHWNRYAGRSLEGISYGCRDDGAIFRLSGAMADKHWRSAVKNADAITRLDLQVTVRIEPPDTQVAEAAYVDASVKANEYERPTKVAAIIENGAFRTVYLGSRQSDTFGRIYDKYAESEEAQYINCWRWEVEVKNDLASTLGRRLYLHEHPAAAVHSYLHHWFCGRGTVPRFQPGTGVLRVQHRAEPDDDDRTIAWYREQVGPTLARVSAHGRRADALAALGIGAEVGFSVEAEKGSQ